MRIGIACPYSWDVPGGVQQHIRDLAEALIELGHEVSVIAPADEDRPLPPYVVPAGKAMPVPYNGSVARLAFGPLSTHRVRRWLRDGSFDVLHVHEPAVPSLSLLACWVASGPIVATVHTAMRKSRVLLATQPVLRSALEKIDGRIAIHDFTHFRARMRQRGLPEAEIEAFQKQYPVAEHPVVRTHPETGRKGLYVNAAFTQYIVGMERAESDTLLRHLYAQASIPEYQCRFRWEANSIAFCRV